MKLLKDKRILAFAGTLLFIFTLITTVFLVKNGSIFNIGAAPTQDPSDIRITNIADNSFTVSYTTSSSVLGTLNFSNSSVNLDNVALDDRDQITQTVNKYTVHSITVRQLQPETTYFFAINSGDKKFINGESPYSVKTGKTVSSEPSDQTPLSGKVLDQNGSAPREGIVYIKINGAQDLSSLTKTDGSYTVPLNSLRNQNLDDYYSIPQESIISIEVQTNSSSTKASANLSGINPVPPITLSNDYDFSAVEQSPSISPSQSNESFPNLGERISVSPTQAIPATPTALPSISSDETNIVVDDISPTIEVTSEPQPTIVATGNNSVIIIWVFSTILVLMGIIFFTTSSKKNSL